MPEIYEKYDDGTMYLAKQSYVGSKPIRHFVGDSALDEGDIEEAEKARREKEAEFEQEVEEETVKLEKSAMNYEWKKMERKELREWKLEQLDRRRKRKLAARNVARGTPDDDELSVALSHLGDDSQDHISVLKEIYEADVLLKQEMRGKHNTDTEWIRAEGEKLRAQGFSKQEIVERLHTLDADGQRFLGMAFQDLQAT